MLKIDSIKYRLLLITFVCVFGMLLLIVNQIYYTDRLIELNQQNKVLLRMGNELLQLRRHEKDFLLRKDSIYVDRFLNRASSFKLDMIALADIFSQHNVAAELIADIEISFEDYQNKFSQLVELMIKIGLDENSGQLVNVQSSVDSLQTNLKALQAEDLQKQLLQIREHEKNFLLHHKPQYLERQTAAYIKFSEQIEKLPGADSTQELARIYQEKFAELVSSYQVMGLRHTQGLRGDFRAQAHIVEQHLEVINSTLRPLISKEEKRVKVNGLLIMGLTIAALVILIVRSFVTFQRAFSNFVMFFYRCKREYQRMDERKLGFAEFKSLAAVANEMVEARRETEAELKEVKRELAVLKKAVGGQ